MKPLVPPHWLLLLLTGAMSATAHAESCDSPNPLRFALIPKKNLTEQYTSYRPLLDMLEKKLRRKVELAQAPSYGAVIEGLLAGNIDIAELGSASYALTKKRDPSSIEAFATHSHVKGTFTQAGIYYFSLLIVRQDSPYQDVKSLAGKNLSLTDPASTSGAVIPKTNFAKKMGLSLEQLFGRITYAGSHERSMQMVQKNYVDAAFVASTRLDEAIAASHFKADDFRVLWHSDAIPNEPTVYRTRLCPEIKNSIQEVYLNNDKTLAPMLARIKADKFVRVSDQDFAVTQSLLEPAE